MVVWDKIGQIEFRHKETFLGNVYILYLDSDDGNIGADICQNPLTKCM